MVVVNPIDDHILPLGCAKEQLGCPRFCSQGIKIPVYYFGTQYLIGNSLFGELSGMLEEQSILDFLLLGQWEERMWKGHFMYDITASEIKVIRGRQKFLAQLSGPWSVDSSQDGKHRRCHLEDLRTKQCEELLFCVTNSDKEESELVHSASVPHVTFLIIANVNPIEYGHVFLVPHGFDSVQQAMDARFLETVARVAVEINNCSFHVFYDTARHAALHLYFQACYFQDLLPVEHMPVDTFYGDGCGRIRISTVLDYPIKTLVFESNCNLKILAEVLAEICSFLLDKDIMYNLMIAGRGKRIFLFLQVQTSSMSSGLAAWECAGYFLFKSMQEFGQITEAALLKRLSTASLDNARFMAVKQLCCSVATKIAA